MAGPNPWDSDPVVGDVGGMVPLPTKPPSHFTPLPKTDPRFRPDYPSAQVNGDTGEVSYGPQLKPGDTGDGLSKQQAMEATRQLVHSIEKARGFVNDANGPLGNTATGLGYKLFQNAPLGPTEASQLKQTIKGEIQGNIFQQWMNSMKAAVADSGGSAFGGRILQSEIPFIVNSRGALTPESLHTPQFLGNLDQVENSAIRSAALLNNENPDDPKVMQKYRGMFLPPKKKDNATTPGATLPPSGDNSGGGGGNPTNSGPNGPTKLSPDQQRQFFSILESQGPDAADAYLRHFGLAMTDKNAGNRPHSEALSYPSEIAHNLGVGLGGVAQGVGDIGGIIANPFTRAINYLLGTNLNPDMGANLRDTLGLPAPKTNEEKLGAAINQYGTQALSLAGAAKAAAARVPGVVGSALEAFGNHPLTDAAAGAAGGGAAEGTRQAGGGPLAQTAAALAVGAPVAAIGSKINPVMRATQELPAIVRAGQQEGVTVPRAMANPALEPKVIATGKTMAGAKSMRSGMANVGSQIEGRTQALGSGGEALDNLNLGEKAQGIGQRYIKESGSQFGRQYDQLKQASEGVPIQANQSVAYIDNLLARLNKTPDTNAKEISYLTGVRNDLARGLDVESARDIGSRLSRDIRKGDVTFGPMEKDVLGLRGAVSSDIQSGLSAAGKGNVAARFKQVDGAYQQRMDFIRNTIQKLTGPRDRPLPPEQAAARIKSWAAAKGDSASLQKIMGQAQPDERADIAATFADSLGKDRTGNFNTGALAKNVGLMPRGVRSIIFGEDGARSLDNLRLLAQEHARVTKALGGSPTALAGDARSWVMHMLFGGGLGGLEGGGTGAVLGSIVGPAAIQALKIGKDAFSAKALMSPRITGWLRMAPKTDDPAKVAEWMNRLKVIATREPALSPEVNRIQNAFFNAANSNVTPSVAASRANQDNGNE